MHSVWANPLKSFLPVLCSTCPAYSEIRSHPYFARPLLSHDIESTPSLVGQQAPSSGMRLQYQSNS